MPPACLQVVDVNRTCKGTRTGGLYRYSCMVVVGNGNGVLGWGQGKAAEVNDSVQKAYQRACRNLYPVPRYNDHTIPEAIHSKFGQVRSGAAGQVELDASWTLLLWCGQRCCRCRGVPGCLCRAVWGSPPPAHCLPASAHCPPPHPAPRVPPSCPQTLPSAHPPPAHPPSPPAAAAAQVKVTMHPNYQPADLTATPVLPVLPLPVPRRSR